MLQESVDLIEEADALHGFLCTLGEADWSRPTPFLGWTPWDVVAHLHFFDHLALLSLTDPEAFAVARKAAIESMAAKKSSAGAVRDALGHLDATALLDAWWKSCREMARQLGASDAGRRLAWFGPDMGVRMFTTARYMETWAHGQDVYDLMRVPRTHTDRIKNIAVLGVKTFGWTFVNRGLPVPGAPPYVRLIAPSGAIWEWNDAGGENKISGDALEFCQVVTQGRNIADTALEVEGEIARRWMAIAQCFAGGPVDPPPPGTRAWK